MLGEYEEAEHTALKGSLKKTISNLK